jgi:hypothetical protein
MAPAPLSRLVAADIWLARQRPGVQLNVWLLVCLCAVDAMDFARRAGFATGGAVSAAAIGRRAVAYFWARLQTFCDLNVASAAWRRAAPPGPFIRYDVEAGAWRLAR